MSGFSVRESGRAKRLSIKVYPRGRVEVVVPKRTRSAEVREFVEAHSDWIRKAREQFAAEHPPEPFVLPQSIRLPPEPFVLPQSIRLDGIEQQFNVVYEPQAGAKTVRYRCSNHTVVLFGKTALSALTNNSFKKMHVRGQRTCWGSHSSSGTISLNYCLMFLDPAHLRYVMIHELCHAKHMNHSQRYWRYVGQFEPNYKQLDKDLNSSWKNIPTWVGIY